MLGADMSQRESVEIQLSKADQIKEDKETPGLMKDPEATVNVRSPVSRSRMWRLLRYRLPSSLRMPVHPSS